MIRAVVVLLLLAHVAWAEDVVAYEAEGDAAASAADARTAALDDAFAHAVSSALADLVAGDVRTAHQDELDREIIGHARLWVARFTVTKDEVDDDRRALTVSVRIDRDKLRARLGELNIATQDATPAPAAGAPTATVLLRVVTGQGAETTVKASFGKGADHALDGVGELVARVRGAGYAIAAAPDDGPPPSGSGDVPEVDADALAGSAHADVVALAGVTVGAPEFVRGQARPQVLATAHVRLFDHKGHAIIGQGTAVAAAPPDATADAIDRALGAATADALPAPAAQLGPAAQLAGDDHPLAEPGVILVRVSPKTPLPLVFAEQRYLAGAKGVRAASLRRLSPAGWVIGVTTDAAIDRVAQIAKKAPAADTSSDVKVVGDVVEVGLTQASAP